MEIEILSHAHFPASDPKRLGQMDTLIIYRVDGKRTDSLILPGSVDDVKVLQAKITEHSKSSANVVGHKFQTP